MAHVGEAEGSSLPFELLHHIPTPSSHTRSYPTELHHTPTRRDIPLPVEPYPYPWRHTPTRGAAPYLDPLEPGQPPRPGVQQEVCEMQHPLATPPPCCSLPRPPAMPPACWLMKPAVNYSAHRQRVRECACPNYGDRVPGRAVAHPAVPCAPRFTRGRLGTDENIPARAPETQLSGRGEYAVGRWPA